MEARHFTLSHIRLNDKTMMYREDVCYSLCLQTYAVILGAVSLITFCFPDAANFLLLWKFDAQYF